MRQRLGKHSGKTKGFTLLELMISLTLVAIVLSFATPTFLPQIIRHQSREGALAVFSWLKVCRSQAVTSARAVRCEVDFAGDEVTAALIMDVDNDGVEEQLYSKTIGVGAFSVRNTDSFAVEFDAMGFVQTMAPNSGLLTLCGVRGAVSSSVYEILVAESGVVRINESANAVCA